MPQSSTEMTEQYSENSTQNTSMFNLTDNFTAIVWPEKKMEQFLMIYVLPVIIIVGTFGNGMSFLVMIRPRMRNNSVYFYLMALAIADTMVLYVSGFKTWIRVLTDFELTHISSGMCKLIYYLLTISQYFAAWLIVLITIDRFVAVWFPFQATILCNFKRACIATLCLQLTILVLHSHMFWTIHLLKDSERYYCTVDQDSVFMKYFFDYFRVTLYSVFPFAIILALNLAIIVRLRWTTPLLRQQPMTSSSRNRSRVNESSTFGRQARVTYMLLAVSCTWLLLTGPFSIYSFIPISSRGREQAKDMLIKAFCFILMYTNHAINFFLYCVTGKKFRHELKVLLCITCKCRKLKFYPPSFKTQRTNVVDMDSQEMQWMG